MHSKKISYFIIGVRDVKQEVPDEVKKAANLPDDYKHECHDSRTWGYMYSKKKAIKAVEENWTDMNEAGYYDYVCIEPHKEGLLDVDEALKNTMWFKAKYKNKACIGYEKCEAPKFADHTVNWWS